MRSAIPGYSYGARADLRGKEAHFFRHWVREEWGRVGERVLEGTLSGAAAFLAGAGGFDEAEEKFAEAIRLHLRLGAQARSSR